MKLGIIAAGALEEIAQDRASENSPNLTMLVRLVQGEPVYDPIVHFFNGVREMRDDAIDYCKDIAFVDGVLLPG